MTRSSSIPDLLRRRLAEPLPGLEAQLRMAPQGRVWPGPDAVLRPAAALLLLYEDGGEWCIPLTVRSSRLRHHTGQVALPGGRLDRPDESPQDAALREAYEEIGVAPAAVEVLGPLTPLPIAVSGHVLHPIVGLAAERPRFALAADEVERLIELRIERLLEPDAVAWDGRVPFFEIEGARVWGATAMVLAEFAALLG